MSLFTQDLCFTNTCMNAYKVLQKIRKIEQGTSQTGNQATLAEEYCQMFEVVLEVLLDKFCANACLKPSIVKELNSTIQDMGAINRQIRSMNQTIIELLPNEMIEIGKLLFSGTMEEVQPESEINGKELEVIGEDEEDPEDEVPTPKKLEALQEKQIASMPHIQALQSKIDAHHTPEALQETVDFIRPEQVTGEPAHDAQLISNESFGQIQEEPEFVKKTSKDVLETSFGNHSSHHFTPNRNHLQITDSDLAQSEEISENVPVQTLQDTIPKGKVLATVSNSLTQQELQTPKRERYQPGGSGKRSTPRSSKGVSPSPSAPFEQRISTFEFQTNHDQSENSTGGKLAKMTIFNKYRHYFSSQGCSKRLYCIR